MKNFKAAKTDPLSNKKRNLQLSMQPSGQCQAGASSNCWQGLEQVQHATSAEVTQSWIAAGQCILRKNNAVDLYQHAM